VGDPDGLTGNETIHVQAAAEASKIESNSLLKSASAETHVCHVISYIGEEQGGPVLSMAAFAMGSLDRGCRVSIASMPCEKDGPEIPLPGEIDLHLDRQSLAGRFRWAPRLLRRLKKRDFSLVHSHGLWTYASLAAFRVAGKLDIPHVLAPCGMLQPRALLISRSRKQVAARLFQDRVLKNAECLHAKSEAELQSIRDYGLNNPVAIIPNPIPGGPEFSKSDIIEFKRRHSLGEFKSIVVFLGRLHPVKGLEDLLHAWARLRGRRKGWGLLLAGPDEGSYRRKLELLITELGLEGTVRFSGALDQRQKWAALQVGDLFVMPSRFENFGSAIAEALSAGLPVITTTATPWASIGEQQCGWCVEPDLPSLETALAEALSAGTGELERRGASGRALSTGWALPAVSENLLGVYDWLLGKNRQPDCVIID
jgi:glycosyltransferase involved in cell wall biosynthesis